MTELTSDASRISRMAPQMGNFDELGNYQPREIVQDDLGDSLIQEIEKTLVPVKEGDIVKGTVVRVDRDEVLVDLGYKAEGVIPLKELSIRPGAVSTDEVHIGQEVEAIVLAKEDEQGRLVLSKKRAQYERAWVAIEKIRQAGQTVKGEVIEVVRGGLIVDIGLRGFLPSSLVDLRRPRDLSPFLGQTIEAKVIELDRSRNNVVLSRRKWLEESQAEQRQELLASLKPGDIKEGVVSSVVSFGAFVDLGGLDGLIHVSELSWRHVDHPSAVVSVGDKVKVQVLEVDYQHNRVSLSLRATQTDPWHEFATAHKPGELVFGRVTKLVPFGAFIQVGENIEGLVHISEMAYHHVESPEQVVRPGDELWVKIIDINSEKRRISLSIKQAAEGGELAAEYREVFGDHAWDEEGNYIGGFSYAEVDFTPETESQAAWADYGKEMMDPHGVKRHEKN
jgi:small subunit ribosomal protein S1